MRDTQELKKSASSSNIDAFGRFFGMNCQRVRGWAERPPIYA